MRSTSLGRISAMATVDALARPILAAPLSLIVSVSVPAAPHDGQAPNHCSAVAPHSEQT
jgi:hypothetical protein